MRGSKCGFLDEAGLNVEPRKGQGSSDHRGALGRGEDVGKQDAGERRVRWVADLTIRSACHQRPALRSRDTRPPLAGQRALGGQGEPTAGCHKDRRWPPPGLCTAMSVPGQDRGQLQAPPGEQHQAGDSFDPWPAQRAPQPTVRGPGGAGMKAEHRDHKGCVQDRRRPTRERRYPPGCSGFVAFHRVRRRRLR